MRETKASHERVFLQVIREAIDVFQKKNETFRLASKELTVPEPVSWVGEGAVGTNTLSL